MTLGEVLNYRFGDIGEWRLVDMLGRPEQCDDAQRQLRRRREYHDGRRLELAVIGRDPTFKRRATTFPHLELERR